MRLASVTACKRAAKRENVWANMGIQQGDCGKTVPGSPKSDMAAGMAERKYRGSG